MRLDRQTIAVFLVVVLVSFAFGRYSAPEKVRVEKEIVTVEKLVKESDKTTKTDVDKDRKTDKTVTEVVKPDGTKIIRTRVKEDVSTNRTTEKNVSVREQKDFIKSDKQTKTVESSSSKVTISALGGVPLNNLTGGPVYGCHISRPLIGPIAVGLWGLTNTTAGVSIGLQF